MTPRRRVLSTTYAALWEVGPWRAIPGCPGRHVLPGTPEASPQDLVGANVRVHVFEREGQDTVHVARVPGGGLISYAKPQGFVHTLNTSEGFERKLAQLGLAL